MKILEYKKGDATKPAFAGNDIIAHIFKDIGGLGKGFVMAISGKWKEIDPLIERTLLNNQVKVFVYDFE
ncbi:MULTISPECIES: hypothetical protein [Chryseobacterium]|nr:MULTISPECIES: hypothetical protein [Chryseobacterium]